MTATNPDKNSIASDTVLHFRNKLRTTSDITDIVDADNITTNIPDKITKYPWVSITRGGPSGDAPTGMGANSRIVDTSITISGWFLNEKDRDIFLDALRKTLANYRDTMLSLGYWGWRFLDRYENDDSHHPQNKMIHIVHYDIENLLFWGGY